jgi:hypothetical protein
VRQYVSDTENIYLLLGLVAFGLILSIGLRQVFPGADNGPQCTSLTSPPGGNQRSILAGYGGDAQSLELELEVKAEQETSLGDPEIKQGQTLILYVVFKNEDIGSITLFMRDGLESVGLPGNVAGLFFEIKPIGSEVSYSEQPKPGSEQPARFQPDDLHLLEAKRECRMTVEFSPDRLARMGIVPGEYRIRAFYINASRGVPLTDPNSPATPTATPMFQDQGVWAGQTETREVRFVLSP